MAKVTKSMLIGELLTVDPNLAPILMRGRNALSWMPVFPDGITGRGSYGSWTGCGRSRSTDQ